MDDPITDNEHRCEACGKPLRHHLGLTGTCRKLSRILGQAKSLRDDMLGGGLSVNVIKMRIVQMVKDAE